MLRTPRLLALVAVLFSFATLAAPDRDIVGAASVDGDDASAVAITNRLLHVNDVLDKAGNRLTAIKTVYALPPGPCIPVVTHVTDDQPECIKQISALNLAHEQAFALQRAVAAIDAGSDASSVDRNITRAVTTYAEAKEQLGGIIGPEMPGGIIGPEIAGIIGPEIAGIIGPEISIIGPELAGIIGPEVSEIIGPEISGIIGPEITADVAGIIGPEIAGIIGPEREATIAELDAAILESQKRLVLLVATRRALEPVAP